MAVTDQTDVDGEAQSDSHGIDVNLYALGLAGLGEKLEVGERSADYQQGVAFLHHILRGRSTE